MPCFEQPKKVDSRRRGRSERASNDHLEAFANREVAQRLIAAFDDFKKEYGTTGVQALIQRLKEQQTLRTEDIAGVIEQIPSREELKMEVLDALKKEGCLRSYHGHLIADLEKIRRIAVSGFRKKYPAFNNKGRFARYFQVSLAHGLFEALEDTEVISTEDWNAKDLTPKPLFYQPDPIDGPYEIEKLAKDKSYLGLWEFMKHSEIPRDLPYPGQPASELFNDVTITAIIYHPRYGNGYRDENGRLMVFNPKTNQHQPITSDWFTKVMHYTGGPNKPGESFFAPTEYLQKYGDRLQSKGILKAEDFRQQSMREQTEIKATRVERNKVSSRGTVMIYGVMHYLGRKFGSLPIRIVELGPNQGGIFTKQSDGSELLTHTFTIVQRNQPDLNKWQSGKNEYGYAGPELTNVQPVENTTAVLPKETRPILEVSRLLQRLANVRLADLSPTMQERIAVSINTLTTNELEHLGAYVKRYGIDGVKGLVSSENPMGIIALSEHLGPPLTRTVLKRYNNVLLTAERETERILSDIFKDPSTAPVIDRKHIEHELIKRASVTIRDAENAVQKSPKAMAEEILEKLTYIEANLALFASVFRTAYKGKKIVPFEELKGIELVTAYPRDLTDAEREKMLKIAEENWKDVKLKYTVLTSLSKKFEVQDDQTRFHLLKKNGEIIGFLRFDDLPDGDIYAGSLNISPALRGSAIGEALLNEVMAQEGSERSIHAHADPQSDVLSAYVERFGFVVEGVEHLTSSSGKPMRSVRIRRDPPSFIPPTSKSSDMTLEHMLQQQSSHDATPFTIMTFDRTQGESMLDAIEQATKRGQVVTRFFEAPDQPGSRVVVFDVPPASSERRAA